MRIVIAGAGEVGYHLAMSLAPNHDVIIIEKDVSRFERVSELDVVAINGNAANMKVLRDAGVERADVFLAVTGNDEVNLLSGLAAKKVGAKNVIVRVENPEYVDRPIVKEHPLGYDVLICPQLSLAQEAARLIGIPGAIEVVTFSGGKVEMIELQVMEGSKADGKAIADLYLPQNVVIASIYRNGHIEIPRGDTVLRAGDRVAIVSKTEDVEMLKGIFGPPVTRRVTIFGAGTIGSYTAKILAKGMTSVKLIESSMERCEALSGELEGVRIVCGDATDIEFLIEEEIGKSDAVLAATESDEKNLLISLLSKNLGARIAIAKVEKREYVKLFEAVGVDVALNPRSVTYNEVSKLLRTMRIETLAEIEGTAVVEVVVRNTRLVGKALKDLPLPKDAIIGAIVRGNECLIPRGDTTIEYEDRLLVFAKWDEIEKIEEIFI
ncbi:MAG: Trk system potassium uptake protein TrkA-like protein [Archaeoglobus fulgidus]|uniref:Trk system potassium uptake protein TrkA-like protein n=1 Tax=Archaeoglobus fulgidus TaxID=2234 RepID=A0A101E1A0_ARCFL|nr:Trk system potassium transporter TrkA [Archaeoglobus fulgidus]KUJ93002.1 MAG: Trk system potassium uptake protein TrkA-like protein [Archaeoglobus fulgidus]KUK06525.1 MAG: Trk system potassium uptake protein TrkA-like protein [Archaeoglobus fulgidus]